MNWPYIKHPNMQFVYKDTIYEIDIESWFKDIRIFNLRNRIMDNYQEEIRAFVT
mgnify:CR=1 FL=1